MGKREGGRVRCLKMEVWIGWRTRGGVRKGMGVGKAMKTDEGYSGVIGVYVVSTDENGGSERRK